MLKLCNTVNRVLKQLRAAGMFECNKVGYWVVTKCNL